MSERQINDESQTGVTVSGSAEEGHEVALSRDDSLKRIFGTKHPEIANTLLNHCIKVLPRSEASDQCPSLDERGFMISAVMEMKPRDTFERLLAVQMASTHVAMMRTGQKLANAEYLNQFEAYERAYNKLARTYTRQMETLRKHRNGGKQTVTVQHVNVEDGGQAIVGNIESGGRADGKK